MKIFLSILALLVVSACAGELKPKPLEFEENKRYVYEYIGTVVTGIPSSSSLFSGTRLKTNVEISHIVNEDGVHLNTMRLTNISFTQAIDEITNSVDVHFGKLVYESYKKKLLELTVQYHINDETKHFEWMEVDKSDEPWSLNIKKAIIEMFLIDIAGKQLKLNPDHEHSQTRSSSDEIHHAFDVYEPTSKGSCETMYQVINALPESVSGLEGIERFYWKVIKSRNYQNCNNASVLTHHNWARKGCAAYCKRAPVLGEIKMNNHYSAEESQCSCDNIAVEPLDQQSTSTYFIECMANPYIINAESNSKVTFDNHGTRFISYSNQTLKFVRIEGSPVDRINDNNTIRVSNLTYTLYPYAGSSANVSTHEIPIYNLLIPINQHDFYKSRIIKMTNSLLTQVAETIIGKTYAGENENQLNIAQFMTRIVQNLAHLNASEIMEVYVKNCIVPEDKLYTNTLNSVRRQLFLDAISHVGTRSVVAWLDNIIIDADSDRLFQIELRQVAETLPLNVYAPTTSLIKLFEKIVYSYIAQKDWDSLSAFVVAYGKLIAKACPNPEDSSEMTDEAGSAECSVQKTFQYIVGLAINLARTQSVRGKVLIAQALAYTGKSIALINLEPYVRGEFRCSYDISDCIFLRTTIIYSLHHMIPVEPERIRSLVLNIFNSKTESYEIRLAAFTVFMSTVPKRYELDAVAVSLRNETNNQVITMVRSILEETANLTQACHQPLAQAAREIIATLPEINLDGVYSQASYNEWYSTDKSTGFFANGRFVANNISYIPRHGYLSLGSHWKSLSNPWFTFAFQQKGLENALKHLKLDTKTSRDPRTIDDLWRDLGIESRDEEEFMLKFFVRVYEQTSLFTMDKYTLKNAYKQFVRVMRNFVSDASNNRVDFNWVRFYMPSTYTDIVPTAIGLPIAAIKQNNQIVSLRLTKSDSETRQTLGFASGNINFKITPQTFTSSDSSLSVFIQELSDSNYGVHASKKFNFYVPLNLNLAWNLEGKSYKFTYAIKPVFDKINFHSSNTNFAFIARSFIGQFPTQIMKEKRIIQSLVPAYTHPLIQLKSPEFGMNLNVRMSTERPWFIDVTQIPCDGTVAWLLEKYNEMNAFNSNINLTLVQNDEFPATGIVGSFRYEQGFDGNFKGISMPGFNGVQIGKELTQLYPSRVTNPVLFIQTLNISFATLGHPKPTKFNSTLTLVHAIDYLINWYRINATLENENEALWTRVPRRLVIDGKLERPTFPSDLEWKLENPEDLVGNYITNIAWTRDVSAEQVDTKILIKGELKRSVRDPVIPEMERRTWFHKQCEKDIKTGNATNHACERLFNEQAYFNVVTGKIEFREVEEPVRESIEMVYSELKRSLVNYWKPWSTISSKKIEGEQNVVTFEAAYSNIIYKRPVISLLVQTPTEKVNFTKLFVPVAFAPAMHPMEYLKASLLPKDQTCTVMKDSIRTFDNVTYRTWLDECEFVVAMDCAENSKQFAVTVKGKAGKRSIRVYTPLQTYFKVYDVKKDSASLTVYGFDGKQQGPDYVLRPGTPAIHLGFLPNSKYHEAHQVFIHDGVVNVVLPKENVRIAFDGYYVKITTSPLYVGKTCGLCGNQNQESTYEFLDPGMVDLASNLTAFRDSYSLHNCTDPNPCHDDVCDEASMALQRRPKFQSIWKSAKKATYAPIRKTLVIERESVACFSKYPQNMCRKNDKASRTESVEVPMICLEKNHPVYRQYIQEASRRVITEVATFAKTETLTYKSPVECVSEKESVRGI